MAAGDVGEVALAAKHGTLADLRVDYGAPIGFMLATPIAYGEVYKELAGFAWHFEDKYDGIRAQAHVRNGTARFFRAGSTMSPPRIRRSPKRSDRSRRRDPRRRDRRDARRPRAAVSLSSDAPCAQERRGGASARRSDCLRHFRRARRRRGTARSTSRWWRAASGLQNSSLQTRASCTRRSKARPSWQQTT